MGTKTQQRLARKVKRRRELRKITYMLLTKKDEQELLDKLGQISKLSNAVLTPYLNNPAFFDNKKRVYANTGVYIAPAITDEERQKSKEMAQKWVRRQHDLLTQIPSNAVLVGGVDDVP